MEDLVDSNLKKSNNKIKEGNGCHGKPAIDTLDSSMMKKTAADSEAQGKKHRSTRGQLS